jgi:hypothetical protein
MVQQEQLVCLVFKYGRNYNNNNSLVLGTLEVGSDTVELLISGNSIITQESDTNIPLSFQTKGTSAFSIRTGTTPTTRLAISELGSVTIGGGLSTRSITSTGTITSGSLASFTRISAGSIIVEGNDVSIPLSISTKGVGSLTLSTNTTTRLTISSTALATFANDLTVSGNLTQTGTSTLTGRVGIGKSPHATYACDVSGDVNISGSFRINGSIISSTDSVWATTGTSIYNSNTGNVGIGNTQPSIAPLCVGNSVLSGSDGYIVIGKNNGEGGERHHRFGYNTSFDFVIGDYGAGNTTGTWVESFKLGW